MKKLIFTLILSISGLSCLAQPEVVLGDPFKSSGLDNIYDFDAQICTAAPKGYEAFYISHYGRLTLSLHRHRRDGTAGYAARGRGKGESQ